MASVTAHETTASESAAFAELAEKGHEQVAIFQNQTAGLRAIIAVHSTVLGPGLGGCRMLPYTTDDAALLDVVRLSEAMTYKNSLAGLNLGGGKSVIITRSPVIDREALLRAFARAVDSLGGRYITAEDMGTTVDDMSVIRSVTRHVSGRPPAEGGAGDPSPYTALGVFEGMKACLERAYGDATFRNRHVVITGVGSVGYRLAGHLAEAGAQLSVADINPAATARAAKEFAAKVIPVEAASSAACDIFSPCATGGAITSDNVDRLRCKIIAGGANNQVLGRDTERRLTARGILYAPDFAINAGGVILCAEEFEPGGFTETRVESRVLGIYRTVGRILDVAKESGELSGAVALRMARERIRQANVSASRS